MGKKSILAGAADTATLKTLPGRPCAHTHASRAAGFEVARSPLSTFRSIRAHDSGASMIAALAVSVDGPHVSTRILAPAPVPFDGADTLRLPLLLSTATSGRCQAPVSHLQLRLGLLSCSGSLRLAAGRRYRAPSSGRALSQCGRAPPGPTVPNVLTSGPAALRLRVVAGGSGAPWALGPEAMAGPVSLSKASGARR